MGRSLEILDQNKKNIGNPFRLRWDRTTDGVLNHQKIQVSWRFVLTETKDKIRKKISLINVSRIFDPRLELAIVEVFKKGIKYYKEYFFILYLHSDTYNLIDVMYILNSLGVFWNN